MNAPKGSYLSLARAVFALEADSVCALADMLTASFDEAVERIYACKGRVVVTGMGKCGIIGTKISATLASTGTPSTTVHPAEAVHGDLGMITAQDIVLALSNSGETEELIRLLPTIKKIGAFLIAMTGNTVSTLAEQSDIVLCTHVEKEACPYNLAPTASTTAQLVMGDALAMALLDRREFTPEDYATLHPGGSLGKQLLKVEDVMRTGERLVTVLPTTCVRDVVIKMTETRNGAACVVDEAGNLVGFFSDGDFRRTLLHDTGALDKPVSEVMVTGPTTISAGRLAVEAARIMREGQRKFSQLPVLDENNRLIGLLDDDELLGV